MKNNDIDSFSKAATLRGILKQVQQLSWTINEFEKRYPLSKADQSQYNQLVESYVDFCEKLVEIADDYKKMKA